MKKIKLGLAIILALYSVKMAFDALIVIANTTGVVEGSEFGMLITLAHQLGQVMLWLALYSLWRLVPAEEYEVKT